MKIMGSIKTAQVNFWIALGLMLICFISGAYVTHVNAEPVIKEVIIDSDDYITTSVIAGNLTINQSGFTLTTDNIKTAIGRKIGELEYQVEKLQHDIWHYEIDRNYYKDKAAKYWNELLEAGVYIVDQELTSDNWSATSYKKRE